MSLRLSDYDYELPPELIAERPLPRREDARMLVLNRADEQVQHCCFRDLPQFVRPGDLLVLNNTRVVNARRFTSDGAVELLFVERVGERRWRCMVKPGRKMRVGAQVVIDGANARVEEICDDGTRVLSLDQELDLTTGGAVPLPPYMRRAADVEDEQRYQTVFAQVPGAVAAPTAGLHFTPEMLSQLPHTFVTLHVGTGTFLPVKSENIAEHQMHEEQFTISCEAAEAINRAERVVAIGTTSVRVLESATREDGQLVPQQGRTSIFIHPPHKVQHVDLLLTNFHLPCSTLLMLVSAFAGREFVLRAYAEAIRERYRFYSYGDCMLIL
jgi:S-adenosylmethionine:tRNA ribosyltransferase-isomerase